MGIAPAPASKKLLDKTGLKISQMDVIELNEAFAAQALAVTRELGLPDDAQHVNPNGGAIAIGHPLGASGARLATTAMYQLHAIKDAMRCARCALEWARGSRRSSSAAKSSRGWCGLRSADDEAGNVVMLRGDAHKIVEAFHNS